MSAKGTGALRRRGRGGDDRSGAGARPATLDARARFRRGYKNVKKQPTGLSKEDFVEVCKREGSDPEEKGVDRLLGLGSSSGSAGRVVLSREDKEAAKLGLSVFTHHRVESSRSGSSPTRKKPRPEEKAESGPESHKKTRKEKKKKKKKHKKEKREKEHRMESSTSSVSPAHTRKTI